MLQAIHAGYAVQSDWLVRGLDIEVRPGRVTALAGPNGAGKSTTMRLLAGLLRAGEGHVLVDGTAIDAMPRPALARLVTYVPLDPPVYWGFTVRECVAMGRYCHRGRLQPERETDRQAVDEALEATDCAHLSNRLLGELSGGEARRVALARGLATEARYLLLDEPTANLDIEHSLALLDLVQEIASAGRSVLIALHDLNSVLSATQFAYVLSKGSVRASGAPESVLTAETIRGVFAVHAELLGGVTEGAFRFRRLPAVNLNASQSDPRKATGGSL